MTTFLALYRGKTVSSAELVAVSADQRLVEDFAFRLTVDDPSESQRIATRPALRPVGGEEETNINESNKKGEPLTRPGINPLPQESFSDSTR